jgi:DNA gyrase subunit B
VYIAQPPLYQLRKGKHEEYVLNDASLNAKLSEMGLKNTVLLVKETPDAEPRSIGTTELRALIAVLDAIEHHAKVIARRGMNFASLVRDHRDSAGRLPTILTDVHRPETSVPERVYFHNDAELGEFRAKLQEKYPRVDVFEARHMAVSAAGARNGNGAAEGGNGESEAEALPECYLVRHELSECRKLEEEFRKLEELRLPVLDLFIKREELVTGELPPAKYLLRQGEHEPIELDNLAEALSAIRKMGSAGLGIKRFKGLGEMNPGELWETTMDREKRTLLRVTITDDPDDAEQYAIDAQEADRMFHVLMGDSVEERRRFIEDNAINVKNLDV